MKPFDFPGKDVVMSFPPLNWPGEEFLTFYLVCAFGALALGILIRLWGRFPGGEPSEDVFTLHPYEIAYVAGDWPLLVGTVITNLVHRNCLQANVTSRRVFARGVARPGLEAAVCAAAGPTPGRTADEIRSRVLSAGRTVTERPESLGLVLSGSQKLALGLLSRVPLLVVLAMGLIKINVGQTRHRPVFYLSLLCCATAAAVILLGLIPLHRTLRGDRAVKELKEANAALSYARGRTDLGAEDLSLAVALFGFGVLQGELWGGLHRALTPPPAADSSGGGGSCGSSCGGGCGGGCGGCGG